MPTIKQALIEATQSLLQRSQSPRLDAELLMAFVTGWPKIRLFSEWNSELSAAQQVRFNDLVQRRRAYEPVAYLTGHKEFFGREFAVGPAVLIPRPDTETLIEKALQVCSGLKSVRLLDLGTGSGCIAVTLLAELLSRAVMVEGVAVDLSEEALHYAQLNADRHAVDRHLDLKQSDWFANVHGAFDLIVANPPYIAEDDKNVSKELRFEPRQALFTADNGLASVKSILLNAQKFLNAGAWLLIEIGCDQRAAIFEFLESSNLGQEYGLIDCQRDIAGLDRLICCQKK